MANTIKISKNFWLSEFLPPDVFEMSPVAGIWFLDPKIISVAQFIRDRFGKPITINNYLDGGNYINSGYRDPHCEVGATFSQHKFGRAADLKVEGEDPEEIRKDIKQNWALYKAAGLTTIEAGTPTWLHVDCRWTNQDNLLIVKGK
jgi:hypothetical protein